MGEAHGLAAPLLDHIADRCHCAYLSDLRFLNEKQQRSLAREVEAVSADAAPLWEWNDALEYLTGQAPEQTAEKAKGKIVSHLSK